MKAPSPTILLSLFTVAMIISCGPPGADTSPGSTAPTEKEDFSHNGLLLVDKSLEATSSDHTFEISGTVINRRNSKIGYAQISFNVYDASGAQIGSALANITGLEPDGKWKFKAIAIVSGGKRYKLSELTGY